MGRLIEPMSREEFEKLPKWQQRLSKNALWVVPLAVASVAGIIVGLAWLINHRI